MQMKLITEAPIQAESAFIEEAGTKNLYLEGVLSTAENVNRNGRKYPLPILEKEFDRYNEQHVKNGTAAGELNHPTSSSINPRNTSHRITELHRDGNDFVGKAIVLENEAGNIVKSFIKGGLKVGVSTRALGTVTKTEGVNVINDDLNLICVDVVMNPSNQTSFVNGILEGMDFVMEESGIIVPHAIEEEIEEIKTELKEVKAVDLAEAKMETFRKFMDIIVNKVQ